MIDERIKNNQFDQLTDGDVCMLAGTQSVFIADEVDDSIRKRFSEKDIDITAPMWGAGELMSTKQIQVFEQSIGSQFQAFCDGLAKFGLKQERRRIRLCVDNANITVTKDGENNTVVLDFSLPAGSYATTVIRELLDYTDLTQRQGHA
jgi:tRNA pseudouridine13 synthase